jgi:hypothetical protein
MSLLTKNTIEGLNKNPRTLIIGLEVAAKQKMLDYNDAVKNNNEREAEKLNAEINEIDERIVEIKAELGEESYQEMRKGNSTGGLLEDERLSYASGELVGGQKKIAQAAPPFDKITGDDFSKLREQKQEGGEIDEQMSMLMQSKEDMPPVEQNEQMIPDEKMEDNYIDFILDEALNEEEEDMLMSKLEQDEQLSMIFDKVIEVASEFAGAGPVEGPGSGVSDSIPARLSDGEFVFTAKSVEEIGADELMRMMKDAEMRADKRQQMQEGGDVEEEIVTMQPEQDPVRQEIRVVKETIDSPSRMIADEDEISKGIKSKMMLDPMQRHVRS